MRRYRGFMADSAGWERFPFRSDDVIISTPSKCGVDADDRRDAAARPDGPRRLLAGDATDWVLRGRVALENGTD
jgi:hypothetical protein